MPTNFPRHAYVRQAQLRKNIEFLASVAERDTMGAIASGDIKVSYVLHDIFNDLSVLTQQANFWQDFCRRTGHDPFVPFEEDNNGTT